MTLGWFTRTFFGSKLRVSGTVLGLIVLAGVAGIATGILGVPTVIGVENQFATVNETTTTIESSLHIHNPNPIGVQLGGMTVDYAVEMNGITMATGTKHGLAIETGNSTLHFTTYLHNGRIPDWWVSHIENGERTTLAIEASVHSSLLGIAIGAPTIERTISTDITSALNSTETRPINANVPLISDPVLYLNETSGHWGEVSSAKTPIVMTLVVYNPKPYPITASSIGYEISMNDIELGSGSSGRSIVLPPGETTALHATTFIHNQKLDEWWVTHVERGQVTELSIRLYARIELPVAGNIRIPLDTISHTIETDFFGTKDAKRDENGGGSGDGGAGKSGGRDAGSSGTSEPGRTGDGSTPAETQTPRKPARATETTDDGGGILL